MSKPLTPSLSILKELDFERYLACLYLAENIRDDVATLWAFDAEIARIPHLVSEAMPGEIRLQWWRDLLASGDNINAGPLAGRLMEVIDKHSLPRETFQNYLDARSFDLYNDAMPDRATLEGYLGETVSVWFQMTALCAGTERSTNLADACGHAGMAVGLSRILATQAIKRVRQQVYLPLDQISAHGLSREEWLGDKPGKQHLAVIGEMTDLARHHEELARQAVCQLQQEIQPVFRPLALVNPLLNRVEKKSGKLFLELATLSPLIRYWHVFRGI